MMCFINIFCMMLDMWLGWVGGRSVQTYYPGSCRLISVKWSQYVRHVYIKLVYNLSVYNFLEILSEKTLQKNRGL